MEKEEIITSYSNPCNTNQFDNAYYIFVDYKVLNMIANICAYVIRCVLRSWFKLQYSVGGKRGGFALPYTAAMTVPSVVTVLAKDGSREKTNVWIAGYSDRLTC